MSNRAKRVQGPNPQNKSGSGGGNGGGMLGGVSPLPNSASTSYHQIPHTAQIRQSSQHNVSSKSSSSSSYSLNRGHNKSHNSSSVVSSDAQKRHRRHTESISSQLVNNIASSEDEDRNPIWVPKHLGDLRAYNRSASEAPAEVIYV